VRGGRRVDAQSNGLGAPRSLRRRAHERSHGRARSRVPPANATERRLVGRPGLERDGLPARLLPQVPPLREVFSPLGAGDLPPRPGMTARPLPLPLRLLDAIGRWAIAVVEALGRFGPFLAAALGVILTPPFKCSALIHRRTSTVFSA